MKCWLSQWLSFGALCRKTFPLLEDFYWNESPSFKRGSGLGCSRFCSWSPWCEISQPRALPKLPVELLGTQEGTQTSLPPTLAAPLNCVTTQNICQTLWPCLPGKTPHIHHCLVLTCLKNQGTCSRSLPVTTIWWQARVTLDSRYGFAIPFLNLNN